MSDVWINVRFGCTFFQWRKKCWLPTLTYNDWHEFNGWPQGKFSIYQFFWYRSE